MDDVPVIRAAGELDLATVPEMRTVVGEVTDRRPRALVFDFSEISYMDSSGLGILRRLHLGDPNRPDGPGLDQRRERRHVRGEVGGPRWVDADDHGHRQGLAQDGAQALPSLGAAARVHRILEVDDDAVCDGSRLDEPIGPHGRHIEPGRRLLPVGGRTGVDRFGRGRTHQTAPSARRSATSPGS